MSTRIRVRNWRIDLEQGWIEDLNDLAKARQYPDARLMAVLRALLERRGVIVSQEQILQEAWPDRVVSRDSVSTAIYELRQLLGDNCDAPIFIRTEARRGYRFIAPLCADEKPNHRPRAVTALLVGLAMIVTAHDWIWPQSLQLQIAELQDITQDESIRPLTQAIESTLFGAVVRRNPGRVISNEQSVDNSLRLESAIVACDLGPALVVRLLDQGNGQYIWSRTYSLADDSMEPSLVEVVAGDVTVALQET